MNTRQKHYGTVKRNWKHECKLRVIDELQKAEMDEEKKISRNREMCTRLWRWITTVTSHTASQWNQLAAHDKGLLQHSDSVSNQARSMLTTVQLTEGK